MVHIFFFRCQIKGERWYISDEKRRVTCWGFSSSLSYSLVDRRQEERESQRMSMLRLRLRRWKIMLLEPLLLPWREHPHRISFEPDRAGRSWHRCRFLSHIVSVSVPTYFELRDWHRLGLTATSSCLGFHTRPCGLPCFLSFHRIQSKQIETNPINSNPIETNQIKWNPIQFNPIDRLFIQFCMR